MNFPTLNDCLVEVAEKRVSQNVSPCGNFILFNYNPETDFRNLWNDVNVWCRGIVFDLNTSELVAFPFKKFFNVGQKPEVMPDVLEKKGTPVIMTKEDGSLGVLFWNRYQNRWNVSTRGSFSSNQAIWATEWANKNLSWLTHVSGWTHLFEIVYPENKVVVNYGDFAGMIYLQTQVVQTNGTPRLFKFDSMFTEKNIRISRIFSLNDFSIDALKVLVDSFDKNTEGLVCRYPDGTMAKLKGKDYLLLHRAKSSMTIKNWGAILKNGTYNDILAIVPDEFWPDFQQTFDGFRNKIESDFSFVQEMVNQAPKTTRKEAAQFCLENVPKNLQGSFFCLLSNDSKRAFNLIVDAVVDSGEFRIVPQFGDV